MAYDLMKEKREAIEAGHLALSSLKEARNNLQSAKSWGIWDMLGGGLISTMAKHTRMEQAKENMEQAKYDLRRFSRELEDVNVAFQLNLKTGDFLTFADWFFDGFAVDWMVQDRIKKSSRQVEEAICRVEDILRQLEEY